jgi:hypothetical protein
MNRSTTVITTKQASSSGSKRIGVCIIENCLRTAISDPVAVQQQSLKGA